MKPGIALLIALHGSSGWAQDLLPEGVVAARFGMRHLVAPEKEYADDGHTRSISDKYSNRVTGVEMLDGKMGADAQRLAQELARYDSGATGEGSLLRELNLGTIMVEGRARVDAWIAGLGLGVNRRLTVYAGVPIISAKVNADVRLVGENQADRVRESLGAIAYEEIQDGLVQAAQVNRETILKTLGDAGYDENLNWDATKAGDLVLGASYLLGPRIVAGVFTIEVTAPTGYRQRPENLVDLDLGAGTWTFGAKYLARVRLHRFFWLGGELFPRVFLPYSEARWVASPGEFLAPRSSAQNVDFGTGTDLSVRAVAGVDVLGATAALALLQESSGKVVARGKGGEELMDLSQARSSRLSCMASLGYNSVGLWKRTGWFPPLLFGVEWKRPLSGRSAMREEYLQFGLTAFAPLWSPG